MLRHIVRGVVLIVTVTVSTDCTTATLRTPTPERPSIGCVITCPNGYSSRVQHLCRGGPRWFKDITIVGEYVVRGADGTMLINEWVAINGDYDKQDVVLRTCDGAIADIIQDRRITERGQFPGEDPQGHPKH